MKRKILQIAAGLVAGMTLFGATPVFAVDAAQEVYASFKDHVLQVRIIDRGSGSKAAIGSGFAVSADGLVISNYHVVSELVERPENYRAEFLREDGSSGELQLLDVDVVHDLAVLRTAEPLGLALELAARAPAQGEFLYSFGNPHDLGMTIVQGTYNGLLEKSLYEKIHFTGSINPGMSGGPTLNRAGEVVGVNVSTAGNQLSFLVPVKYVARLLENVPAEPLTDDELNDRIRDQLLANQQGYMNELLEADFAAVEMNGYSLPGELAASIRCWGDTSDDEDLLYERVIKSCSTSDDIFLSSELSTGVIRFRHNLYTTSKLSPVRFYNFLENGLNQTHVGLSGDEEGVGNYSCKTGFVENRGLETRAVLCLRAYKKYEGLFDLFMTASTLDRNDEALQTSLVLAGVSEENAERFARTYLESIEWTK